MSLSTEKPLVERDQERKATESSKILSTETPESPIISTRDVAPLWIELESYAQSVDDKSDHDTASVSSNSTTMMRDYTNSAHSENLYDSASGFKASIADEKRDYDVSHHEMSAGSLKECVSIASTKESDIVYPSTLRVLLVALSLAIAIFLVGLDRTIVATAT